MTFSIIIVCLNAGNKLHETVESVRTQTERDYEIIVKDGCSEDRVTGAYLDEYEREAGREEDNSPDCRIRVYRSADTGIYDAMNQAVQYVRGDYVLFLNCGDRFYDAGVLAQVKERIKQRAGGRPAGRRIYYGDVYECRTGALVQSNPVIDDFACYRNLPCHQACFYDAALLRGRSFDTAYAVRADYEHFLWCYYRGGAETVYIPVTVAFYEGGGFSETRANERRSKREHREIVSRYMPARKVRRYRLTMLLTLAPLRTWIARNPVTAGIYQTVKSKLYR